MKIGGHKVTFGQLKDLHDRADDKYVKVMEGLEEKGVKLPERIRKKVARIEKKRR